jgi:hypothetical protein
MAWTNRGKYLTLGWAFNASTVVPPAHLYAAMVKTFPTALTNVLGSLTEADGNGSDYVAGGIQLSRNATDFPSLTEDDTNNAATIQIKDLQWTASGGPLPKTGSVVAIVLTTDEVTVGTRQVIAFWLLSGGRSVLDGIYIKFINAELDLF